MNIKLQPIWYKRTRQSLVYLDFFKNKKKPIFCNLNLLKKVEIFFMYLLPPNLDPSSISSILVTFQVDIIHKATTYHPNSPNK